MTPMVLPPREARTIIANGEELRATTKQAVHVTMLDLYHFNSYNAETLLTEEIILIYMWFTYKLNI